MTTTPITPDPDAPFYCRSITTATHELRASIDDLSDGDAYAVVAIESHGPGAYACIDLGDDPGRWLELAAIAHDVAAVLASRKREAATREAA